MQQTTDTINANLDMIVANVQGTQELCDPQHDNTTASSFVEMHQLGKTPAENETYQKFFVTCQDTDREYRRENNSGKPSAALLLSAGGGLVAGYTLTTAIYAVADPAAVDRSHYYHREHAHEMYNAAWAGMCVGAAVGIATGIHLYRKMTKDISARAGQVFESKISTLKRVYAGKLSNPNE